MEIIKAFLRKIKRLFFKLNTEQRKHVSKVFDTLAIGSALPVFMQLVNNETTDDFGLVILSLLCAIVLEIIAIAALAAGSEE